ncbi:MAG: VOC family protein [Paracoccaceae bacterium]
MLVFDHLAVAAGTLAEGVAFVEAALGVSLAGGGQHAQMGTHNRLLGLGDLYLEVIAVDPGAEAPGWPRWFDLDRFAGPPRLANWVVRCDDLAAAVAGGPVGVGARMAFQRGDYRWQMAVPADGRLPFGGGFPALIQWEGALHPAPALPDAGVRLLSFEISHPEADGLRAALAGRFEDGRVRVVEGPQAMRAWFDTLAGERVLG